MQCNALGGARSRSVPGSTIYLLFWCAVFQFSHPGCWETIIKVRPQNQLHSVIRLCHDTESDVLTWGLWKIIGCFRNDWKEVKICLNKYNSARSKFTGSRQIMLFGLQGTWGGRPVFKVLPIKKFFWSSSLSLLQMNPHIVCISSFNKPGFNSVHRNLTFVNNSNRLVVFPWACPPDRVTT